MSGAYARLNWCLIIGLGVLTIASLASTGLNVDCLSHPLLFLPFGLLAATWWFYSNIRPNRDLQAFAEGFTQILLILLFGTLLTYAAAAAALPFQDGALLQIDRALGIDRHAYIDFFDKRPWLYNAVTLAYFTLMPQFLLVPLVLYFKNQPERVQQFIFVVGISLTATALISAVAPSITTVYLDLGLPAHAALPANKYTPVPTLEALRSGLPYSIDLSALEGLVSFPSFHTIGALLFIWSLWTVSYVRWIALIVNIGVIAAAPFIGAHYFIDIAAGAIVVSLAIAAARHMRGALAPAAAILPAAKIKLSS